MGKGITQRNLLQYAVASVCRIAGLLGALAVLSPLAYGQGVRVDNPGGPATKNVQNFLAPIPGASIQVCTSAGTGTPCTPLVPTSPVTLCTDATCTVAAANPFPADANGNWGAWLLPGTYKVSITANGATAQLLTVTVPVTPSGNIVFTGQDSFSQQITSTVSTGTAPFSIASTTVVPNLNSQLLNGLTAPASAIVGVSDSQTLTSKTLTSPIIGTSVVPTVAGGPDIGSTSLPFHALWLGTAATNNFELIPQAIASQRFINLADPLMTTNLGLNGNGTSGVYQSKKGIGGCATAASIGGVCASAITVTWFTTFQDTNYSAGCSPSGAPTNLPSAPYIVSKANASITVNYFAITAAAASWASIDCWAIHD